MFAEPEARIVVFTGAAIDVSTAAAQVDVITLSGDELTFTEALRRLRREYDVRFLLCEGGPTVLGALLREGVLDEVFLTLAPDLTGGGDALSLTSGPELPALCHLHLAGLLRRNDSLYLRYQVDRNT
jgi:riboflavin biosynthesis pyrimidine reductase